jgi:hypothetical protein
LYDLSGYHTCCTYLFLQRLKVIITSFPWKRPSLQGRFFSIPAPRGPQVYLWVNWSSGAGCSPRRGV